MHWFDELFHDIEQFVRGKRSLICNAGLSVSGLQHVGRLRGEIVLNHVIATELRKRGHEVLQSLVLYTQDQWKGTKGQRSQFGGTEGDQYIGWRLIDVPDPFGCHSNWVDHYWVDFGGCLDEFAPGVHSITTTDVYKRQDMKALVFDLVKRAEDVRQVVNKYRARNPYPPGWIPFEPLCEKCNKIGSAKALELHEDGTVNYQCPCGHEGSSSIERGKLNWRLEWAALWKVLKVDIEPFGKDHATPGGSRDSCKEIIETFMEARAPMGIPYEWVGYVERGRDFGDMKSSKFIGFTPRAWLEVGDPEVLRYVYMTNPIKRRVVLDLGKVDIYHDYYDAAESSYYGGIGDEDRRRSFELAQLRTLPDRAPFRVSFSHASLLAQIAPRENLTEWSVRRLKDTGMLDRKLTQTDLDGISRRLEQARNWVAKYAPPEHRVKLLERLPEEVKAKLLPEDKKALGKLLHVLSLSTWKESTIKNSMMELTKSEELPVDIKRLFAAIYLVFLGVERGPRAAPFLSVLEKDFVLSRLKEASS